jgi:hypothetical protein
MGAVGAMARGSADRYFQQDIKDTLKLEPAIEQLAVRDSRAARSSILTVITFSGSSRPRRT